MKIMSESLGIDYQPEGQDIVPFQEEGGEVVSTEQQIDEASATNYEDLNEIIRKSKHFGLSLMDSADTYELHNRPRIYEVANQLLSTSIAAIKSKHAYEFKTKEIDAKKSAKPATNNTQVNNYFGTRDELLKMMRQAKEEN